MSVDDTSRQRASTGARGRLFVIAVALVGVAFGLVALVRRLRDKAPSGARARAELVAGRPLEAKQLASQADALTDGGDPEARAVLDELELADARALVKPAQRAEAVSTRLPRTEAGRQAAERLILDDAEQAVLIDDGTTIEEIRFAARAWPNASAVNAQLLALRELVVLQRCVKATKLVCAALFAPAHSRHPAVAARIEAFRTRQVAHSAAVFRESQALLNTKPDPTVAGAAQRDQVLAAAEHKALALPKERDDEIVAYAESHRVEAFHAKTAP